MLRSYVKGALSYVLPQARDSHADLFPVSAALSYSQFLRHLVLRAPFAAPAFGESVAELGPGSSIGFGLAALLAGAAHYQAFDVAAHFDRQTNLRVFDELVALFQARAPIPHEGEFVRLFPFVDDHAFPPFLTPDRMGRALEPGRLARLRADIEAGGGEAIRVAIGMSPERVERPVDWLASHSVLEHVDELEALYAFMARALAPGGVMTHLIDFSAHGLTPEWNGHWTLGERRWTLLRGRRTYLINRAPLATHRALLEARGLEVVDARLHRRVDGALNAAFAPAFRAVSSLDASTHMAFLVCRDRGAALNALPRHAEAFVA